MDASLTIRTATVSDVPTLAQLSDVLGYPATIDVIETRLRRLLQSETDVVFVAEAASGDIVGWLHGAHQILWNPMNDAKSLGL